MKKYISQIITNPFISSSLIMIIGSNSVSILNYLYHLVMVRLLGPVGYGDLASIISIIGLLGVIPGSLSLVIIKYISSAKTEESIDHLISWFQSRILKVSLIFFVILLIITPFITDFMHVKSVWYLIIFSFSFLFSLPSMVNRSILQGVLKFKELVISSIIENIIKLLLGILLAVIGFSVGGALTGWTIAVIVGWYISGTYIKIDKKKYIDAKTLDSVRSMILFTIPAVIYSLATTSLYSTDIILVKHFFSSHEAGLYAAISTLGKIIFFGTGPIVSVMFPLISKRFSEGRNYTRVFVCSLGAVLLLALPLLLIYWMFPEMIISFLYGSSYFEIAPLLIWFTSFITLFTLCSLFINFNLSLSNNNVVIFPSIAAILQIIGINSFHKNLFEVILVSIIITALLLISLLLYSFWNKSIRNNYGD